jgi:hypothetical protein
LATKSEQSIARAAKKKPNASPSEIQQDSVNKRAVNQDAQLGVWEQEVARAGFVGRWLGWGPDNKANLVFVLLAFVVVVMGLELLFGDSPDTKHQILECFKFLSGALIGYFIRNKVKA